MQIMHTMTQLFILSMCVKVSKCTSLTHYFRYPCMKEIIRTCLPEIKNQHLHEDYLKNIKKSSSIQKLPDMATDLHNEKECDTWFKLSLHSKQQSRRLLKANMKFATPRKCFDQYPGNDCIQNDIHLPCASGLLSQRQADKTGYSPFYITPAPPSSGPGKTTADDRTSQDRGARGGL